jgi:hypothetical protein
MKRQLAPTAPVRTRQIELAVAGHRELTVAGHRG